MTSLPRFGDFGGGGKSDLAVHGYGRFASLLFGGGAILQPFGGSEDARATTLPRPRHLRVKVQAATLLSSVASTAPVASAVQVIPPDSSPSPATSLARRDSTIDHRPVAVRHTSAIAQRRNRPA